MNKQVVEQPRAEAPTSRADSPLKSEKTKGKEAKAGQEFAGQLSAAALLVQHNTPQLSAQSLALSKSPEGASPEVAQEVAAAAAKAAKATKGELKAVAGENPPPALSLNTAASTKTGSTIAGLNGPVKSTQRPTADVSAWVLEGQSSPLSAPNTPGAENASPKQAARGEVDTALESKLRLLNAEALVASGEQPPVGLDPSAGTPGLPNAAGTAPMSMLPHPQSPPIPGQPLGTAAAPTAPDAALEAQLASLGGVLQGLGPSSAEGRGAVGTEGRPLIKGAAGRMPAGTARAGLSGGEFLSALGAAKGEIVQSRLEQGSQFQGESGEGKGAGFGGKSSLHVIQGGAKGSKAEFESELTASQSMGNLAGSPSAPVGAAVSGGTSLAAEVTGHVVQGANAENRLSSESLAGVGGSIRNFANQGTGGEMRIRLKPENLGELHVRVMTDGRNVGLQIQASDEKSKKILEESLTHLKDSLATQNLSLGTVELTVAQSQGAAFGDSRGNPGQAPGQNHGQEMFNDMLGRGGAGQSSQGEGRHGTWAGGNDGTGSARAGRPGVLGGGVAAQAFSPSRAAAYGGSGRIDVTA